MNKKFDILVIGELNVDLILNRLQTFPKIGAEIMADEMTLTLGSSSAIFASNACTLGARVAFAGKIGFDSFGSLVLDSLRERNVNTDYIKVDYQSKTGASIILNFDNDRAIVTYAGAMEEFDCPDISDDALKAARHVHISSLFLQPGIKACLTGLVQLIKRLGLTVSVDPQWDPQEKWDIDWKALLQNIDVFLPNEQELLNITGLNDVEQALRKLASYSENTVIVAKMGTKGSMAIHKGRLYSIPAFLNEEVVDAIGAGDSFNAGFIVKWVNGAPLEEALRFGNLTGAVNTTAAGGTGAFQSFEQVRQTALDRFNVKI